MRINTHEPYQVASKRTLQYWNHYNQSTERSSTLLVDVPQMDVLWSESITKLLLLEKSQILTQKFSQIKYHIVAKAVRRDEDPEFIV